MTLSVRAKPAIVERNALIAATVVASFYLYLLLFIPPALPIANGMSDDAIFLTEATRILKGQVIYRDFFDLYFPATSYLYALLVGIFGARAWLPNACLIGLGISLFWGLSSLARGLISGTNIVLPGLLFMSIAFPYYLDASPHWYAILLVVVATSAIAELRSTARLMIAGALAGVATCFAQHHGAFGAAGIAIFIGWEAHRDAISLRAAASRVLRFLVPYAVIVALCIGYFATRAGFGTFFFSTVIFPARYWNAEENNVVTANILSEIFYFVSLHNFPKRIAALALITIGAYAAVPIDLVQNPGAYPTEARRRLALLAFVGLALLVSIANSAGFWRVAIVSPPAFVLFVWLLDQKLGKCAIRLAWAVTIIIMALDIHRAPDDKKDVFETPSGPVAIKGFYPKATLKWLANNTRPGEYVFETDDWSLYFWFHLQNPTRLWWLTCDEFSRPEQVAQALDDLRAHEPEMILWRLDLNPPQCPATNVRLQPTRDFLHSHYALATNFPGDPAFLASPWVRFDLR